MFTRSSQTICTNCGRLIHLEPGICQICGVNTAKTTKIETAGRENLIIRIRYVNLAAKLGYQGENNYQKTLDKHIGTMK